MCLKKKKNYIYYIMIVMKFIYLHYKYAAGSQFEGYWRGAHHPCWIISVLLWFAVSCPV